MRARISRIMLSSVSNCVNPGYKCHLLTGACPPSYQANLVRARIGDAVKLSNGTFFDLHRRSQKVFKSDAQSLQESVFCPHAVGDVYTSPRLYTSILSLCIPIIISDYIQLPFSGTVAWGKIVLRVPEANVTMPD